MAQIAQIAAWYHWSLGEILDLEHPDRERFLSYVDAHAEQHPGSVPLPEVDRYEAV